MTDEERRQRRREAQARYKAKYPERVAASAARWRAANPDKAKAATESWRESNKERALEQSRRYKRENKDRVAAKYKLWAERNRAKLSAKSTQYQKDHPEVVAERSRRRRARKAGAPVNDFSESDWRELLNKFGHACAYCGRSDLALEREHVVPLARGGSHTKDNIVPACGPCNRRKATKTADEFLAGTS